MNRVAFALLAIPIVAVAAPVPRQESDADRFERLFGMAVLPKKVGKFELKDDTLTVTFPKGEYVGSEDHPLLSPHTAREVEGDFELTASVRITGPKVPPTDGKQWDMGAGLVAWDEEAEKSPEVPWTIFASRRFDGDSRPNEDEQLWRETTVAQFRQHSYHPKPTAKADPTTARHLRLTRKGDKFTVWVSDDGKDWTEHQAREAEAGKKLWVGVWAYKRVDGAGDVVFENVTLTTGK